MTNQIAQGDLLFVKLDRRFRRLDKEKISREPDRRLILARGEKTGHTHAILTDTASLFHVTGWEGIRLLEVHEPTLVVHDEHPSLTLDPAEYEVRQQREYVPEDKPLQVLDHVPEVKYRSVRD